MITIFLKRAFFLIGLLSICTTLQASAVWQIANPASAPAQGIAYRAAIAAEPLLLTADHALLLSILDNAPPYQQGHSGSLIDLPLPDGRFITLAVFDDPVLAPEIAAQYPHIRSFRVHDPETKQFIGRIDTSPHGVNAMITFNDQLILITPQDHLAAEENRYYLSQSQTENSTGDFICHTQDEPHPLQAARSFSPLLAQKRFGNVLRHYRLALSADYGYHQTVGGGNANTTYAEMANAVSRINFVFERDLGIRLVLASDNSLIATSTSDSLQGTLDQLMNRNASWIAQRSWNGAYDIGHVFSTKPGGQAMMASTCTSQKAQGVTGLSNPTGDHFYFTYAAHEIAHQLGASHTFNAGSNAGYCDMSNRHGPGAPNLASHFFASYEPGSGSTIMAYAGICGAQNLQNNSDYYFHGYSIEQVRNFVEGNLNNSCGSSENSGDTNPPVASAGADYTIPYNTPFMLQGSATDADPGSSFTYSWEQMDLGAATSSKVQMNEDRGAGPLIRSRLPSAKSYRTIPALDAILEAAHGKYDGERLPTTNRVLNFMLTVRSGDHGIDQDSMRVHVSTRAGPFRVTAPASGSYNGLTVLPVSWNVANTDKAPVNCKRVNIDYSADAGENFTTLLANTANNGSARVVLPNAASSKGRIRVKCSDNIFFHISAPQHFSVTANNSHSSVFSVHALDSRRYEGASGTSAFRFAVKRSGDLSAPASIDYHTQGTGNHPATAEDFNNALLPSGTLHFASGDDTRNVTIHVIADNTTEPAETFEVVLSNASAGNGIVINKAGATILDGTEPAPAKEDKGGYHTFAFFLLLLITAFTRKQSAM